MLPEYHIEVLGRQIEVITVLIDWLPIIISLLVFPVYFHVNRVNRHRDKKTLLYPITNHFFRVICLTHIPTYPIALAVTMYIIGTDGGKKNIRVWNYLCVIAVLLLVFVFCVTTSVCSFLIVYLALQRFLIYFLPDLAKFLIPKKRRFFIVAYLLIPLLSATSILPFSANKIIRRQHENGLNLNVTEIPYNPFFLVSSVLRIIIFNGLMFLSAILYIVMVLKIRKFKEMMSQTTVKPERYIMYQVIVLSVCQAYTIFNLHHDTVELFSSHTFIVSFGSILAVTFPCIQITYLFCNRANLSEAIRLLECGARADVQPDNYHLSEIRH